MKKSLYLLVLFTCFAFANPPAHATGGQEKVCFCHNINHNPVTICTAKPALIQAHLDHVNGEVPGVLDSLEECEEEAPIIDCDETPETETQDNGEEGCDAVETEDPCDDDLDQPDPDTEEPDNGEEEPTDEGDEPANEGEEPTDEGEQDDEADEPATPDADQPEEVLNEDDHFEFADQVANNPGPVALPGGPLLIEGTGCAAQLNPSAAPSSAGIWLLLGILPALNLARARKRR